MVSAYPLVTLGNPDTFDVEPRISPDGAKLVFVRLSPSGGQGTIFVRDIATGDEQELQTAGSSVEHANWSPDGKWIIYNSESGNRLSRIASDGSGAPVVILDTTASPKAFKAWYSPDGSRIVFGCEGTAGDDAMCLVNADGSGLTVLADISGVHENYFAWGVTAP